MLDAATASAVHTAVVDATILDATAAAAIHVAVVDATGANPSVVMTDATMSVAIVTAVETIAHSESATTRYVAVSHTPVASVVPAATTVHVPAVTTTIGDIEVRTSEVEVAAVRIAGIDAEVPVATVPVQGTIEVAGGAVCAILPIEQNVAQIHITALPVQSVQVVVVVDAHQIVEVDFVCSLILVFCKIQLIRHLVREEKSLFTCLFVTHGVGRYCHGQQCCQGKDKLFHNRYIFSDTFLFTLQRNNKNTTCQKDFP